MVEPVSAGALAAGAIASGGASIGSSIYSANKSANSAKQSAKRQMAWEIIRAKNAHQWEVQDLKKAGLNPILSATGGSGAQTGGIGQSSSNYDQIGEGTGMGVQNALSAMTVSQQAQQTKADVKLKDAEVRLKKAEQGKIEAETADILPEQKKTLQAQSAKSFADANKTTNDAKESEAKGKLWDDINNKYESAKKIAGKAGKYLPGIGHVINYMNK